MESLSVSIYMIKSDAPKLKRNSNKYIPSCLPSFILDLKDQILFIKKLNQNTVDRAIEFEATTDSPIRSLNTNSKENSIAAEHKPVIR